MRKLEELDRLIIDSDFDELAESRERLYYMGDFSNAKINSRDWN